MNFFLNYFTIILTLCYAQARISHKTLQYSDNNVHKLATLSNTSHIDVILDNILVPRVVGTKNHKRVRNYITNELENLGWSVEHDEFVDYTPTFGNLKFTNIIATLNPKASRYLVLSCHYDSKYIKEYEFVAAIDSAVPCAMMINLAAQMESHLAAMKNEDLSLMMIFFDGEEAFKRWTDTDSCYGSRHLAEKWDKEEKLNKMELLVLLDLLGTPDPKFYNYFSNTADLYTELLDIEEQLADMGEFRQYSRGHPQQKYFSSRSLRLGIKDDHDPFMNHGIPVLHWIPHPFPDVWHTAGDNRDAIDMHTVENLNKILRVFVAGYLRLHV